MDQSDALKQIEEIRTILEASNQLLISGSRMVVYGIVLALVPVIELPTKLLTFGADFGSLRPLVIGLTHVVFYILLFQIVKWLLSRFWEESGKSATHPVMKQALRIDRPILACIAATVFVFFLIGQPNLIFPLIMIFFGLLFNFYGRFSSTLVLRVSWSYIILGFLNAYLTSTSLHHVWIWFDVYLALSFIAMGIFLRTAKE